MGKLYVNKIYKHEFMFQSILVISTKLISNFQYLHLFFGSIQPNVYVTLERCCRAQSRNIGSANVNGH